MAVKCIALEYVKPGAILAKSVEDDKGRTLCSAGTEVTARLLLRFERMEVGALYIESDDKLTEELYEELKSRIEKRFSRIRSENILDALKLALLESLKKRKGS